jgi:TDG/mug DNA glycosylase family protein
MLPDLLRPGLRVVIVGTSVSTRSAAAQHYYSEPRNKFWQLLAATGLLEGRPVGAPLDSTPLEMGIGLTDLAKGSRRFLGFSAE